LKNGFDIRIILYIKSISKEMLFSFKNPKICYILPMTDADIKNLAHLARIEITDDEVQKFKSDTDPILAYVAQINDVQIDDIHPEYMTKNLMRPDVADSADNAEHDLVVKNAPDAQDGFYKVPKIL
jgi:aspartyl-tRNA(Asn)/glutamyl-tRNA(Gln) amidotransferase subunit C